MYLLSVITEFMEGSRRLEVRVTEEQHVWLTKQSAWLRLNPPDGDLGIGNDRVSVAAVVREAIDCLRVARGEGKQ